MCKDLLQKIFPCLRPKPISELKGLAMASPYQEDLLVLGVDLFAVWGWNNTYLKTMLGYVPMARNGYIYDFYEGHPPYALFLNEPNKEEPFGSTMSPEGAVVRFLEAVKAKPHTTFVVGNVSFDVNPTIGYGGIDWLMEFICRYEDSEGKPFDHVLGCHAYGWSVGSLLGQFRSYRRAFPSHRLWLTEFGLMDYNGVLGDDYLKVVTAAAQTFEAYFAYTNRQIPDNPANLHDSVCLFDLSGVIRQNGRVYAGFPESVLNAKKA